MSRARRNLLAGALIAAAALAAPALAQAGTVTYSSTNVLSFTAAAGEANRLTLTISGNRVVYTEGGGLNITEAEADCDGTGTPVVSCEIDHVPATPVYFAGADLGDMDDRATAAFPADSTLSVGFSGGAGVGELDAAASQSSSVSGGDGVDTLTVGRGQNSIVGGPDNDIETGGPAGSRTEYSMGAGVPDGADDIRGGPGLDVVSYEGRTARITAAADGAAGSGEDGEGDKIATAVEGIQGGSAGDLITASPAVDGALSGYGGNDRLVGGPGDDTLFGGEGDDTLEGGAGDDVAATG